MSTLAVMIRGLGWFSALSCRHVPSAGRCRSLVFSRSKGVAEGTRLVHPTRGPGVVTHFDPTAQRPLTVRYDSGGVHQYTLASASKLKPAAPLSVSKADQIVSPPPLERGSTEHEELERVLAQEWESEADRLAATPVLCAWASPLPCFESSDSTLPASAPHAPAPVPLSWVPHTANGFVRDVLTEASRLQGPLSFLEDDWDKQNRRKNACPIFELPARSGLEADLSVIDLAGSDHHDSVPHTP